MTRPKRTQLTHGSRQLQERMSEEVEAVIRRAEKIRDGADDPELVERLAELIVANGKVLRAYLKTDYEDITRRNEQQEPDLRDAITALRQEVEALKAAQAVEPPAAPRLLRKDETRAG